MKLKIVFTGICSILKERARIVLPNAERVLPNCEATIALPMHRAYVRYKLDEDEFMTTPDIAKDDEGALFLDGVSLVVKSTLTSNIIKYPDGGSHIPNVASMGQIYPGYKLKERYLVPAADLSHVHVAALFELKGGEFVGPNVDPQKKWHFFPSKGTPVRGPLAQAVEFHVDVEQDACELAAVPFGSSDEVFNLKLKSANGEVEIVIGNTIEDDIFPCDPDELPEVGPDYHFELYYRLTELVDGDCPPIPYFEGFRPKPVGRIPMHSHRRPSSHTTGFPGSHRSLKTLVAKFALENVDDGASTDELPSAHGISLGGANCPPNQWP